MVHTALIIGHTVCGLAAFGTGFMVRRPPLTAAAALFRAYLGALWLMAAFLIAVVALDWGTVGMPGQLIYAALTLLGLYTCWRGWQAQQELRRPQGDAAAYVAHVGFTLIALFDGFVIIGALDLGAPVWLVIVVGALGIVVGRLGVHREQAQVRATG